VAFELPFEELDGYIEQICTGRKLVFVEDGVGNERALVFRYPIKHDQLVADLIYRQALKEAEEMEIPSIEEVELLIRERGIFTEEDEGKIEKLKSRMEGQKAVLAKTTRVRARIDRLTKVIADIQEEINLILLKREAQLENTRERKASEYKHLYLTQRGVYDPYSMSLWWETKEDFEKEPDFRFRRKVFVEYIVFSYGLRQEVIRFVARSNVWRIRYVTATNTSESLFGVPIKDYSVDQLMLLYWSHYYQSINEMLPDDKPSDEIIEDDQALDAYMRDWQAERGRDTAASRAKKGKRYGDKSAWDHGETLVMKSNPMHQDIDYSETLAEKSVQKGAALDAAPIGRGKKKSGPGIG